MLREIRTDKPGTTPVDYPEGHTVIWPPETQQDEINYEMTPLTLMECLEYFKRDGNVANPFWLSEVYNVRTGERIPLYIL